MFRIAICDDEASALEQIESLGREYLQAHPSFTARLSLFESGQTLLNAIEDEKEFDLYLLDVLMPKLNGIEVGKELRRRGKEGAIIYLTTSPDYAVDSYLTQAFFYLLKPVERGQFFDVLDRAVAFRQKQKAETVIVKSTAGLRAIPLDSILYLERVSRSIRYYLTDGEIADSRALRGAFEAAVSSLLEHPCFILCGASFAFNLQHIKAVEQDSVLLDSGKRIRIPRAARGDMKKAWMYYWLGSVKL